MVKFVSLALFVLLVSARFLVPQVKRTVGEVVSTFSLTEHIVESVVLPVRQVRFVPMQFVL